MNAAPAQAAQTARPTEVNQAGERRIARVESLRAVAALGVMISHAWGISHVFGNAHGVGAGVSPPFFSRMLYGGGYGVYLFFALSGYLLFWPFARSYFGDGAAISLRRYAINRAVRILPLYWTAVILLLLVQQHGGTGEQWWRFILLCENFSPRTLTTVDGSLWSVVVEVHFYILLPLLSAGIATIARSSRSRAALLLLLLGGLSIALDRVTAHSDRIWQYNLPTTFFYFVPGMLLALLRLQWQERRASWLKGPLCSSGVWLLVSASLWLVAVWRYDVDELTALASFFAVAGCVLPLDESRIRRGLDLRPLARIGVVSYSLYVWHLPIQLHFVERAGFPRAGWAVIAITTPIAAAVAFFSYRLIEEPFLKLRRRWSAASAPIASSSDSRPRGSSPPGSS